VALDRLQTILGEKIEANKVFKKEDYKSPSWAYEAADRNGFVRALQTVIDLLEMDHK